MRLLIGLCPVTVLECVGKYSHHSHQHHSHNNPTLCHTPPALGTWTWRRTVVDCHLKGNEGDDWDCKYILIESLPSGRDVFIRNY